MRVLFCSVDSPGFLYPLVGLALELRERGHAVAFATGLPAGAVLQAAGMERLPRGREDGRSFELPTWFDPLRTAIDVKHVQHAIRRFGPDVLVTHQLCQAPLLLREMQGIPVAVMGLFSYLWPVDGSGIPEAMEKTRHWRVAEGARILNEARELFRLSPGASDDVSPLLADAFMLRTVPALHPGLDALPASVHAVGPCLWSPPHGDGAWDALRARFPRPDAPVIYAQQGRIFRSPGFWPQLVEALGDEPVQVVASTGRMDRPVGDLPPNFLVEPHVDQGLAMPHARAVVSAGTTTVSLGALAHGLPHVVVPGGGETRENADALVDAGCALSLAGDTLTAQGLREALDGVQADAAMLRRCAEARQVLGRAASFGAAAARVEALAAGVAARTDEPAFAAA